MMKLRNILFMSFILMLILVFLGDRYVSSKVTDEEAFKSLYASDVFNESKYYGVNGMGVAPMEKIFIINLDVEYEENIKFVQAFFEKKLVDYGIKNYEVEVRLSEL